MRLFTLGTLLGAAILGAGCGAPQQGSVVTVKGSDTMQYLVNSWAEAYAAVQPGNNVAVSAGGSGVGIAAIINGTTDICMASREMRETEIEEAKQKNVTPKANVVALDGLAIVVHPSNPVSELTMEQVKLLYTGQITSWAQLGGEDTPVFAISRESSSGTYGFFLEHVLDDVPFADSTRLMPATSAIVSNVSEDKGAVGYVGLGYANSAGDKIKIVAIKKDDASPAVIPSIETVTSGEYSIARPLYLYTTEPESEAVANFIAFCRSAEGQAIVAEMDYVPVQ